MVLELGKLSVMPGSGIVGRDCVREFDVEASMTWATVVDFLVSFPVILFLQQLLRLLEIYWFFIDGNLCCELD